jgi:hypothetical protein
LVHQPAGFVYYGVPWFGAELASAIYEEVEERKRGGE